MDNQPMQTQPYVPPKKSSGHGCLIAALVVGGLLILTVMIIGFFAYRYVQTDQGKAIWGAFTEAAKIAENGMNAPGTAELRELGCKQAFVMDMGQIEKLGDAFRGMGAKPADKAPAGVMVMCTVGYLGKGPSCDLAAATYVKALGGSATQPFMVMVKSQSSSKADCFSTYSEDGKLKKSTLPAEATEDPDVEKAE
jgi:hypothetical protein